MKKIIIAFTFSFLLSGQAAAKDATDQAINICALAIPMFNQYIVNYEYLHDQTHGLGVRLEYAPMSDEFIDATGVALALNYRWHISKSMDSIFVGVYTRYRVNTGTGTVEGTAFEFTRPELTAGLNVGKRWTWDNGFNTLFSLGYGASMVTEDLTPKNASIDAALTTFKNDNDTFFDAPFYGEFSIGYAF
ncbi:MAG: DUF3575 domain-containing protein [Chromatiales bacterium]|nr:DUF3575 domain-containing protein [Chromatiales bacterium]